ncbi:MAG TPA: glycoside hydrolase N-terminal domain-containing protein [Rhodanobacteraceae bacterium]|nr:glycoside hydrolase N-terminal domain-containing protein [Rhodanobacteraceae bacterium]
MRLPARRRFLGLAVSAAAALPFVRVGRAAAAEPLVVDAASEGPVLWYPRPARSDRLLFEGLPVGNGTLGALAGGPPDAEILDLALGSFWTGGRNDAFYPNGHFPYAWSGDRASLPPGYRPSDFGSFQSLARLALDLPAHAPGAVSHYRRELDLGRGLVRVEYDLGGAHYARELFVSHPDRVLVLRLRQSGGGSYRGSLRVAGTHGETTRAWPDGHGIGFAARLPNGLDYALGVRMLGQGGRVVVQADRVDFADCAGLTLLVAAVTDYAPEARARFRRRATFVPARAVRQHLAAAARHGAESLQARHVADYRMLFDRMHVDLGESSQAQRALDTWSRLQARARTGAPDPELEAAYLQFGRYLTIAGSRGSLPTNLQGLWMVGNHPPWQADYHTDVNLEMNYWLPDRAGLGDCFAPLADFCLAQLPAWRESTRKWFNDPHNPFRNTSGKLAGWTVAISENIYGGNGWRWHPPGNAWLCNNLWHHYQYTLDRVYLERIFPLLRGACEFWQARLLEITVADPQTGKPRRVLVDDHDWSPEQGPDDARGITYAQELVWDLFTNFAEACRVLRRDAAYAQSIAGLRDRLYLPEVSPLTGWLEEWMTPKDLGSPTHRHLSPLIGLFPGDRITPEGSPAALVAGARRLLAARGMHSFGWGNAWRALCWARLKEGDAAYRLVGNNLAASGGERNGTAMNLLDVYALGKTGVFQIDSNYGTPAAMLAMLLYSRPGHIELLPALPRAWSVGRVTGIGARGGFEVDLAWNNGRPTEVTLRSVGGTRTKVAYRGVAVSVQLPVRASRVLSARTWTTRS